MVEPFFNILLACPTVQTFRHKTQLRRQQVHEERQRKGARKKMRRRKVAF